MFSSILSLLITTNWILCFILYDVIDILILWWVSLWGFRTCRAWKKMVLFRLSLSRRRKRSSLAHAFGIKKKICGQVWIIFLSLSLGFAQLRPSSSNVRSFFLQSYEILQNWQPLFFECNQGSLHFSFLIRPMSMTRLIAILTSKVHKPDLFAFILFFL